MGAGAGGAGAVALGAGCEGALATTLLEEGGGLVLVAGTCAGCCCGAEAGADGGPLACCGAGLGPVEAVCAAGFLLEVFAAVLLPLALEPV